MHSFWKFSCILGTTCLHDSTVAAQVACSQSSIPTPSLPGARIEAFTVAPVYDFAIDVPQNGAGPYFDSKYTGLNFCNVTVTYSYLADEIDFCVRATVWLPLKGWNGRFQGTGGGGFFAGLGAMGLAPAVADGFAAAETDGGHSDINADPENWALNSQGHVDIPRLTSFASTSLNDLAVIGKAVTNSFYGISPKYSYWNGCSTGGRQGLMLAQRYPDAFDGIAALSPAINWPSLTVSTYWPQQVMNQLKHWPHECELVYITTRAVQACDGADGVTDGILSLPGLCEYDANEAVGDSIACDGDNRTISAATAAIANAAWNGNGVWYGLNRDAFLAGMANTKCTSLSDNSCSGNPFGVTPWIPYFVEQDPNFPINNITNDEYYGIFNKSVQLYQTIIGTADPDLSSFKQAGGKMITTHGLADPAIFPNGTRQYYQNVLSLDAHAQSHYRYFEVPGVGHCGSPETNSYYANDTIEALVRWVEHGVVPETLIGINQRGSGQTRPLCPYPKEQHYSGGSSDGKHSFSCV